MDLKAIITLIAVAALVACNGAISQQAPSGVTADRNTHPALGDAPNAAPKGYQVGKGVGGPEF